MLRRTSLAVALVPLAGALVFFALHLSSCADDAGDCADVTCGAKEYCDLGQCVPILYPDYTPTNACDPLRACRLACGTDARCVASCEAARSPQCVSALDALGTCERRSSPPCESGPYQQNCCFSEFCAAFPSHPNCGNVPPCQECSACGSNDQCLRDCVRGEPACAGCIDSCRQDVLSDADCDARCFGT
jgi:hypothetical protein